MSRTVRRMPMKKERNLRNTKPDYASIRIEYDYPSWSDNYWGIVLTSSKFRIMKRKQTRKEKEKEFAQNILKFSRKNGISVKRRQHAIRDMKKYVRRQEKYLLKRQLFKELNETSWHQSHY